MYDRRIQRVLMYAYRWDAESTHSQVCELADALARRYPDYGQYRMFHVLVGGSPPNRCDKVDFPNREVRSFARSLVTILNGQESK